MDETKKKTDGQPLSWREELRALMAADKEESEEETVADLKGSFIDLSVRELVEFVLKSGSIDARYGGKDRMLEGARIHRQIQSEDKKIKRRYESEVYVGGNIDFEGVRFHLSGRADAMYQDDGKTVIEELKSTDSPLKEVEVKEVHQAQLFFYGYLYLLLTKKSEVTLELTYISTENSARKSFRFQENADTLKTYISSVLEQYLAWAKMRIEHLQKRARRAKELPFVFDKFRKGQREMSLSVWNTLKRGHHLLLQAPTGIGKTISSLYPSVKMFAGEENPVDRIFYLTAKTQTQKEAEKAARLMREKKACLRSCVITAKDKICPLVQSGKERQCDPDHCPYAKDYFDKINPVLFRILAQEEEYSREKIEEWAKENMICPFELSLDLSSFSDLIIADYNYVFDPNAALIRFEGVNENAYLIDEAHNLPDRSREMYSVEIEKAVFDKVIKEVGGGRGIKNLKERASFVSGILEELASDLEGYEDFFDHPPEKLESALLSFIRAADSWRKNQIKEGKDIQEAGSVLSDAVLSARNYLQILEYYGENYQTRVQSRGKERNVFLKLVCLDASEMIKNRIGESGSAVFFSATLTPFDYYRSVFGMDQSPVMRVPSPFPRENLLAMVDSSISTKYKDREKSKDQVARDIASFIQGKEGNYIVFFPSYQYLQNVLGSFEKLETGAEIMVQEADMGEEERQSFFRAFDEMKGSGTRVGFCVMGGAFSEGMDLPGEKLIGVVVVGPGIPMVSEEREKLKIYYDRKIGQGYNYAYKYPGMNKVLQAAGRVIRTASDKGAVLFIDSRFLTPGYQTLFPEHLKNQHSVKSEIQLKETLDRFWNINCG